MTKSEILRYSNTKCPHRHPYLAHPECLRKAIGYEEKIGFLDIETSNFSASFGVVISWCIKEKGGKILEGHLKENDFKDKEGFYDKRILADCVNAIREFDKIIVYWGKDRRFDIPFLRTRALSVGLDFPVYQERLVNDAYDIVKNKFKFGRNSLAAACSQLGISSKETPISPKIWMDATIGRNPKAIKTILQHNREDVVSTEKLWDKIHHFTSNPKTSI